MAIKMRSTPETWYICYYRFGHFVDKQIEQMVIIDSFWT